MEGDDDRTSSSEGIMDDDLMSASESAVSSRPSSAVPPSGQASIAGSTSKRATGGRSKEPNDLTDLKAGKVLGAPYLKGELIRDVHGDHVFRGMWSMNFNDFDQGGVKSEFELKHRSTDPDETELFPFAGAYSGWYKLKEGARKDVKHEERDVQLAFMRHSEGGYNVEGVGRNQFGSYKIKGLLADVRDGHAICEVFRVYQPLPLPPPAADPGHHVHAAAAPRAPSPAPPVFSVQHHLVHHHTTPAPAPAPPRPRAPPAKPPSASPTPPLPVLGSFEAPRDSPATTMLPKLKPPSSVAPPRSSIGGGGGDRAAAAAAAAAAGGGGGGEKKKKPSLGGGGGGGSRKSHGGGGGSSKQMTDKMVRRCMTMIKDLRDRGKQAMVWFNRPVTEVEAPGYFTIISQPMDLGTVDSKLRNKGYSNLGEFISDVRLVFQNAMRYNGADTPVYHDAQSLLGAWNDIYKKVCGELKIPYDDGTGIVRAPPPKPAKKKPDPPGPRPLPVSQQNVSTIFREAQADDNPLANSLISHYKEQMEKAIKSLVDAEAETAKLKGQIDNLRTRNEELESELAAYRSGAGGSIGGSAGSGGGGGGGGGPRSLVGTDDRSSVGTGGGGGGGKRPSMSNNLIPSVTHEERELLGKYVSAISESDDGDLVEALMDVIKQHRPSFGQNDDFEVDVHAFDDVTVRALLKFCEPYFEESAAAEANVNNDNGYQGEEERGEKRDRSQDEYDEQHLEGQKRSRNDHHHHLATSSPVASAPAAAIATEPMEEDSLGEKHEAAEGPAEEEERHEAADEAGQSSSALGDEAMETEETRKAEGGVAEGGVEEGVKGEEDDVMEEEEEEEAEEEEEEAVGGSSNLQKWLEPKGTGGGEEGGEHAGKGKKEGEQAEEGGTGVGGSNDLWDAARQMKEKELAREQERAAEEVKRQEALKEEEARRKAELLEEQERLKRAREEEEAAAKQKLVEEAERKQKEIADARERARLARQEIA